MKEKVKLAEGKYFYQRMIDEQNNVENFTYNLSAFLSASRSVLQYACKEAENISGGKAWYDSVMSTSLILTFFKNKRDINIHNEPVFPAKNYSLTISETLSFSESVSIDVGDRKTDPIPKLDDKKSKGRPATVQIKYTFNDWAGNEDVLTLSQNYIQELEMLVNGGIIKGFIKG